MIRSQGYDPKELSELAIGRFSRTNKPFLNQIISSAFDVDKMDFVVKDSYHTGAGYGSVDVFRLIYTMDVVDGNLAADITALPTLESLILARLESFRTIYFHRACRAVHMMLLKASDLAKEDLEILSVKRPDEYLAWDDFTVWSKLLANPNSREIMKALSERRLLKCAYERTLFAKDELVSSVFTNENVRLKLEEDIATKAHAPVSDVGIDVPSLPSVPYHYAMEMDPVDIPVFSRDRSGEKIPQNIGELSKVVEMLRVFMNIVRVYTKEQYR